QLSKTERAVLNRLLLHKGQLSTRLFKRELIRANLASKAPSKPEPKGTSAWSRYHGWSIYGRSVTHIGQPHDPTSTIFEDVIARLTFYGLVFSTGTATTSGDTPYKLQYHPSDNLFIPTFVRQHLPKPEPLPEESDNWQPAHLMHGNPQLFLRDLYLYWDTVRRDPISMIKAGFVGKRGLKQLNNALLTPDPTLDKARQESDTHYLYLLRQILQELKLVRPQNGTLQTVMENGRSIPKFWQQPTAEQVKAVVAIWHKLPQPLKLISKESLYDVDPDTRQACRTLLKVLATMPATTWIDAETLLVTLQEYNSDFLVFARSRIENRQGYYYYGNPTEMITKIDRLEEEFVAQVMSSFLFQMGLVELGFDTTPTKPTSWHAFRFTPLGTAVLQNKYVEPIPTVGQIIIQPNFQILAMGPVPLSLLAQLDLFAERQKVDPSAFEYHLSKRSVYAAQQRGFTVSDIQQFLDRVTPNALPQNIQRSLLEWAAHHERIVFRRNVTLLQAADNALLDQLLADKEAGKLLARPVGEAVALVKSKRHSQLVNALQKKGLLPAVSGANPEAADKSVVVDNNGRIQPIHAVPSLHLSGRLARFTQQTDGGWQLTEPTVRHAGGSKIKTQQIIDELRKLNRGQLPKPIVTQIKAWGGYYGPATVGTMTLFEFRNHETLTELCKLSELKELLQPFPAGERALAVVSEEQVTAVQSILTQLGVKITSL
ncbi:MAG: hypothetical protein GY943_20000, partial [Chloroflexi bacterium]|nr:hypothetical protein [Chloroflexota bacterium]